MADGAMTMVDRWSVRAPIGDVFAVLSDLRTYAEWGQPTYVSCSADGEPKIGATAELCIRGALPMQIRFRCQIVRLESPTVFELTADGDLEGRWLLRLAEGAAGTDVHSTWVIQPKKALARMLSPVLSPLFRWNHHKAMTRTFPGLEAFVARRTQGSA
jgi:hypothetical protein